MKLPHFLGLFLMIVILLLGGVFFWQSRAEANTCGKTTSEPAAQICANLMGKYYHDSLQGKCRVIPAGVCMQNGQVFDTEAACEATCTEHRFILPWLR